MRTIRKKAEPKSLTRHRSTPGADWDGYSDKAGARKKLCEEQGYICAFCLSRIKNKIPRLDPECGTKIAHWHPRRGPHGKPALQLTWSNLLACCPGGELMGGERHCDTSQGDTRLRLHPVLGNPRPEQVLVFQADGTIFAKQDDVRHDVDVSLNLNCEKLRIRREAIIKSVDMALASITQVTTLNRVRRRWAVAKGGEYEAFFTVALARIDKRLQKVRARSVSLAKTKSTRQKARR